MVTNFLLVAVDPASAGAIKELIKENTDLDINSGVGPFFVMRLVSLAFIIVPRIFMSVLFPSWMRERLFRRLDKFVDSVEEMVKRTEGLEQLVELQQDVLQSFFPTVISHILPRFAAGMAPLGILGKLTACTNGKDLVLTITRGLPHNVTTVMDLKLWSVAKIIKTDDESLHHFISKSADELASQFRQGTLPDVAQGAVSQFMMDFGMRGLYEIDIGRPRWREESTPLMNTLKSYVEINEDGAPDKVFANGEKAAEKAIDELGEQLNKPRLVSFLASRVRQLAGLRELPKFTIIRVMGIIREKMLVEGDKLVSAGTLHDANDLFYLETKEIKALAKGELVDCKSIISERKQAMVHESKRTRLPRVITSDGFAFFGGTTKIIEGVDVLSGEPVSPGVYEGRIQVVHDPSKTKLNQGDILCCHGTDPSWTPLFLSAGALVMEVGGLMTHGSVVAREYGIPAIVGLEKITERLKTGQFVRVDGSSGTIEVLK
jgi:pyruvate,water dikinase